MLDIEVSPLSGGLFSPADVHNLPTPWETVNNKNAGGGKFPRGCYTVPMALPLTPLGQRIVDALGDRSRYSLDQVGVITRSALSRLTTDPSRSERAEALRQLADQLGVAPMALLAGHAEMLDGHWQTLATQLLAIADTLDVDVADLLPRVRDPVVVTTPDTTTPA